MYEKYKDAEPQDTIGRIRSIFEKMGIHLECQTDRHINGIYTSYLTDSVCRWRTEGKGTTQLYCEASAYGEAMEHLSTYYAFNTASTSEDAIRYRGFRRYPDEQLLPVDRIPNVSPTIMKDLEEPFVRTGKVVPKKEDLLAMWKKILNEETTAFVPYFHINANQSELLPDAILAKLCGTNGGGCGNTPHEAIGHALDEIMERWCKYRIFTERLTPPEVPDEYLKERCPELWELKLQIEKRGSLRIIVLDATMGMEYPVMAIAAIDIQSKRYLVNFGSHPLFEIALERCFTEIFQDRKMVPELLERRDMAVWADWKEEKIFSQQNWAKLLADDLGLWPAEFFSTTPSWEFRPWPEYDNYSNRVGMKRQIDRLLREGLDIYIRNVSFLDFPVYKVYVPGLSISHINYTEEIFGEFTVRDQIRPFLREQMQRDQMRAFGETVFGRNSILGRQFFCNLSNEEFDLLHSAFLMEYGDIQEATEILGRWNSENAKMVCHVLELCCRMERKQALTCVKRFFDDTTLAFADKFFSEHPFRTMLSYYHFDDTSRQSFTGELVQQERDELIKRIKDFMHDHFQNQSLISNLI